MNIAAAIDIEAPAKVASVRSLHLRQDQEMRIQVQKDTTKSAKGPY